MPNDANATYYAKNRERILARRREQYADPEYRARLRKYQHDYYAKHPEFRERQLAKSKRKREAEPEAYLASQRDYAAKNREHRRRVQRLRIYERLGITEEWYDKTLAAQGGVCAVCGTDKPAANRTVFCVDHDHATGLPRGLLCNRCNMGLGRFDDDPALLEAGARYLRAHA